MSQAAVSGSLRILVILGSTREGRNGQRVAAFVVEKFQSAGHEVELIDPLTLNLPLLTNPIHFYAQRDSAPAAVRDLDAKVRHSDAYVVVTPQYNASVPPALANLIDYCSPRSFAFKSSGIITYSVGRNGGAGVAILVRNLMVEMGAPPIPCVVSIAEVSQQMDESGKAFSGLSDLHEQVKRFIEQFEWFAGALKKQRNAVGEPHWGHVVSLPY